MRLYDAFQAGSIPVVVGSPAFLRLLPQPVPLLRLASWAEAGARLKRQARDERGTAELHRSAARYLARVEGVAAQRMAAVIDALLRD